MRVTDNMKFLAISRANESVFPAPRKRVATCFGGHDRARPVGQSQRLRVELTPRGEAHLVGDRRARRTRSGGRAPDRRARARLGREHSRRGSFARGSGLERDAEHDRSLRACGTGFGASRRARDSREHPRSHGVPVRRYSHGHAAVRRGRNVPGQRWGRLRPGLRWGFTARQSQRRACFHCCGRPRCLRRSGGIEHCARERKPRRDSRFDRALGADDTARIPTELSSASEAYEKSLAVTKKLLSLPSLTS